MNPIAHLMTAIVVIALTAPALAQVDCADWNTGAFFEVAEVSDVTRCLLAGADLSARTDNRWTPLHLAAGMNKNLAVIEALLNAGADLNARTGNGSTPLHFAVGMNKNLAMIKALLNAGAEPNARTGNGSTALHFAAGMNVRLADPNINLSDIIMLFSEDRSLLLSDFNNNPAIIEVLLNAGADRNAQTQSGWTPLHFAAGMNNNQAVIEALLNAGADLSAPTQSGWSPLHVAARMNENPALIKALLNAGAEPNERDANGWTPLHFAARMNENPAAIEALLNAGAEPNERDANGWTPLRHAATFSNNPAVIEALFNAGADRNERDTDGWTLLHIVAGMNNSPTMIEALFNAGADLSARDANGRTPLHIAARMNENPAMIEALLNAGADPKVRDKDDKTPWDYAKDRESLKASDTYWRLNEARFTSPISTHQNDTLESSNKRWVTSDRLNRRTCPSTDCGIVGQFFFREGTDVFEDKDGWARVSRYYDASCANGRSEYVDSEDNRCDPENGIVDGKFAEWVFADFLSEDRPPDPAADATGLEVLLAGSDDFQKYRSAFARAAQSLISSGQCREADFLEWGGWMKSVNDRSQPIYFIYCGGAKALNRLYLNTETGEVFR